jgi:hypothetical protein
VAPGLGFGEQALRQRTCAGAVNFDGDAGIFLFEGRGDLLVLIGGQSGVPDDFALALGAL